jgi:pimeloyl-ACP methyl ester carboxylesterase
VVDVLTSPGSRTETIRRQIVDTRFGQVHVRLAGWASATEKTPLVLLHMTPLSGAMYEPVLPALSNDRLVVALDRVGFGFSDLPPRRLSMAEYALATLDALDALKIERFDVVGTHTGSVEATELAWAHPARVRKVGLVAIPAYTPTELEQRRYRLSGVPPPAEDGSHLAWHWKRRFLYRSPPFDLPLFQWRLLQELLAGQHGWWPYQAVFDYPMAERLAELKQPLLVLAPHDDLWEQTDRIRREGGLPPGARFVELPHLGLDIAYYATQEIAVLLLGFFDALP